MNDVECFDRQTKASSKERVSFEHVKVTKGAKRQTKTKRGPETKRLKADEDVAGREECSFKARMTGTR